MSEQIFNNQVLPAKDKMFRFALRLLYSANAGAEDAKDVVQDALLKIWDQKEKLKHVNNPEAWCMQITKNLCIDRLRALKVRQNAVQQLTNLDEQVNHPGFHETAPQTSRMDEIKKCIDKLPQKYRMVIHLREVEGFTYQEIAEITEWKMSKVKVNLFRARNKLKEQLINSKVYDTS